MRLYEEDKRGGKRRYGEKQKNGEQGDGLKKRWLERGRNEWIRQVILWPSWLSCRDGKSQFFLSFSINSVLFHSSPLGVLYCFHSSSRARHGNLFPSLLLHLLPFTSHSTSIAPLCAIFFFLSLFLAFFPYSHRAPLASVNVASQWHWNVDTVTV